MALINSIRRASARRNASWWNWGSGKFRLYCLWMCGQSMKGGMGGGAHSLGFLTKVFFTASLICSLEKLALSPPCTLLDKSCVFSTACKAKVYSFLPDPHLHHVAAVHPGPLPGLGHHVRDLSEECGPGRYLMSIWILKILKIDFSPYFLGPIYLAHRVCRLVVSQWLRLRLSISID